MAMTDQEFINKMYDSSLESQKQTLQQDYDANVSNLEAEQQKAQRQTDANLNRTYVEAQKDAKNYAEVQNAYGLSSGAMAQAKLVQNNQMQSDMTTIRAAQQTADAEVERQRSLLAKEYSSAIAQAQADNDMQRAQALYEQAKTEENRLLQQQKEAANMLGAAGDFSMHGTAYGMTADQVAALQAEYNRILAEEQAEKEKAEKQAAAQLMAGSGDYSLYQALYGLTDEQIAGLESNYNYDKQAAAAELMAGVGDYSLLAKLYGLTDAQVAALKGTATSWSGGSGNSGSSGGGGETYTADDVMEKYLELKRNGAPNRELDALLNAAIEDELVSRDYATEIRNGRY